MAIQNIGTTISGIASDTKPTLTVNEKGVIFVETDTNKFFQWDGDSWNETTSTAANLSGTTLNSSIVTSSLTTVGALNAGSITSGFTSIDVGAGAVTTTGLISGGSLDVDDVLINGTTIGHTNDTDLITVADGLVTVAGTLKITGGSPGADKVLTSDADGDASWETAGGGGAMEFVSKTTLSSTVSTIDYTGLTYDTVYLLIIKRLEFTGYTSRSLLIKSYINGGGSVAGSIHDRNVHHPGGNSSSNSQAGWDFYQYGGENEHVTGTLEFYTGYYGYIRGMTNHVGLSNGVRYSNINGTLNASNAPSSRISGIQITNTGGQSWVSGGQVLLYKYKES